MSSGVQKPCALVDRDMERSDIVRLVILYLILEKWKLDSYSEGIRWLCYAVGGFCWKDLGLLVHLEWRVTEDQQSCSEWSLLSWHESFLSWWEGSLPGWQYPIQWAQRTHEWFDKYENDLNHTLWPSQSLDVNPVKQLWKSLDQWLKHCSPPTWSRKIEFIPLVELESWGINVKAFEAALAAHGGAEPC